MTDAARNGAPVVDWTAIERIAGVPRAPHPGTAALLRGRGRRHRIGVGLLYVVLRESHPT